MDPIAAQAFRIFIVIALVSLAIGIIIGFGIHYITG